MGVVVVKNLTSIRWQDFFLISASAVVGLLNPLVVTWDSYLYIGSGQAISDNLMETQYHWLREPLYPLILSFLDNSISYRMLVIIQTISIMVALILWSRVLSNFDLKLDVKYRIPVILMSFTFLWGFGGTVLLQSFWILLAALLVYILTEWSLNDKKNLPYVAFLLVVIQSLSSIFFFCSTLAVGLIIVIKKVSEGRRLLFSVGILLLILIPGLTSFGTWEYFKNTHSFESQIYKDSTEFWNAQSYNEWNGFDKILAIPSTFLALNSMGVEFYMTGFYPVSTESRFFGAPTFNTSEKCGRFFPGPEKYISESRLPRIGTCVLSNGLIELSSINKITRYLYPLMAWLGFLVTIWEIRDLANKNKYKHLSILMFVFLIQTPYLLSNAGISRLGIPSTLVFIIIASTKMIRILTTFSLSFSFFKKYGQIKEK
jgi:hypothetical protein